MREYKVTLRNIIERACLEERNASRQGGPPLELGQPTPRECWRLMVQAYGACALSYEEDRVIAILGVAKRFEDFYQDDKYMIGLWKKSIHTDLMWESNAFEGVSIERDTSIAPSWTWACLQGGKVTVPTAHQKFGGEPTSHIEFIIARIERGGEGKNWELDIKGTFYLFQTREKPDEVDFYADIDMTQYLYGGRVKFRYDTEEIMLKCNRAGYRGACIVVHSGSEGYGGYGVACPVVERLHGSMFKRLGKLFGSGIGWAVRENRVPITLV
uniref:WGS project CBMI000000000 data, contig CS3069_c003220 n=1 Tax=Fusarium clavum TaxID=2594811 RepID=A0A090MHQ4_9HYPO|nr:unnamed protein product [Fusarium clavum]